MCIDVLQKKNRAGKRVSSIPEQGTFGTLKRAYKKKVGMSEKKRKVCWLFSLRPKNLSLSCLSIIKRFLITNNCIYLFFLSKVMLLYLYYSFFPPCFHYFLIYRHLHVEKVPNTTR